MNNFGKYLSPNFIKRYSKTQHLKKILGGSMHPNPPSKRVNSGSTTRKGLQIQICNSSSRNMAIPRRRQCRNIWMT